MLDRNGQLDNAMRRVESRKSFGYFLCDRYKMRIIILFLFTVMLNLSVAASQPMIPGNPLANIPSAPGETVTKIKNMKDNEWLYLGAPAPDPVCGIARGRSWGGHAFAPARKLRGALFTGEGVHAYVKPDGFGMDDWWFYDINKHRWICLFQGTNTKELLQQVQNEDIVIDSEGRAVDRGGQPIPAHLMIHAYHYLTYHPGENKFYISAQRTPYKRYYMPGIKYDGYGDNGNPIYMGAIHDAITLLEQKGLTHDKKKFGPWSYNVNNGKFERELASNGSGGEFSNFPFLHYIQSRNKLLLIQSSFVKYYDPVQNSWGEPLSSQIPWIAIGSYDQRREQLILGSEEGSKLWIYKLNEQSWISIETPITNLSSNRVAIIYDRKNDIFLIFDFWNTQKVYFFNPETFKLSSGIPFNPVFDSQRSTTSGVFYDEELGVSFIHTAGDSSDDGKIWVYKYK